MFDGSVEPGLEYITPLCANCMGRIHFPSEAKFRLFFGVHRSLLEPICVGRIYFPPEAKFWPLFEFRSTRNVSLSER